MRSITAGTMTIAILAILVGLVGAWTIRNMLLPEPEPPPPAPPGPINVPLASTDLPIGRVISLGDIALMSMTREQYREQVELGNIQPGVTMLNPQQIIGRRLRERVSQGASFLSTDFYLEGTGPTVADSLKPGYRAVTIPVREDQSGMVAPGMLVDVLFLTKRSENVPEMTVTFVQAVEVLQTDGRNVALAVTYNDARRLETVQGRGTFSLAPRPSDDLLRTSGDERLTFNEVLGIKPPPPRRLAYTVIWRGGRPSVNLFPAGQPPQIQKEDELGLGPLDSSPAAPGGQPVDVAPEP